MENNGEENYSNTNQGERDYSNIDYEQDVKEYLRGYGIDPDKKTGNKLLNPAWELALTVPKDQPQPARPEDFVKVYFLRD